MIFIDDNHAINFRHSSIDYVPSRKEMKKDRFNRLAQMRRTECEIIKLVPEEGSVVIGHGEALCHPLDQFVKEYGRKTALSRAMKDLDREFRAKVWNAYFKR